MICTSPLAIQATAYWRNSTRLARAMAGIEHASAYATMEHLSRLCQSPRVRELARARCDRLGKRYAIRAKVFAMPLRADNRWMTGRLSR